MKLKKIKFMCFEAWPTDGRTKQCMNYCPYITEIALKRKTYFPLGVQTDGKTPNANYRIASLLKRKDW